MSNNLLRFQWPRVQPPRSVYYLWCLKTHETFPLTAENKHIRTQYIFEPRIKQQQAWQDCLRASLESPLLLLPQLNCPLDKYRMLSGCLHSCHDPGPLLMNARHSDRDYRNSKLSPNSEVGADSVNMGTLNQTCRRWLTILSINGGYNILRRIYWWSLQAIQLKVVPVTFINDNKQFG